VRPARTYANKAHVPEPTVKRTERSSREAVITLDQERKIRAALRVAGMELRETEFVRRPNEKAPLGG
jgi:hypothetical protein